MMTIPTYASRPRRPAPRHAAALALLLAPFALAACKEQGPQAPITLGEFSVNIAGDSATLRATPNALFYTTQNGNLPDSRVDSKDACELQVYSTEPRTVTALPAVDAGDALTFVASGGQRVLSPVPAPSGKRYAFPGAVDITPGELVSFRVPGAAGGYPSDTVSIRTAEAFTFQPIAVPAAGQSLPLAWSGAAADAGTGMIVSLRTATTAGGALNRQLLCYLRDDGAHTIPTALLTEWRSAQARQVLAVRWRTAAQAAGPNAVSYARATFAKTIPVATP